jgi:hypothetical protein
VITNQVNAIVLKSGSTSCYVPFEAELRWNSDDPFAVRLVCHLAEGDNVWAMSRELLRQGSTSLHRVGEGDIKIRREGPVSSRLLVCLRSHEGHADIGLNQPHVVRFLQRVEQAHPMGSEDVTSQIDDFLEELYRA